MTGITSTRRTVPVECSARIPDVCTHDVWNVNMAVCDACFAAIHAEQAPILFGGK